MTMPRYSIINALLINAQPIKPTHEYIEMLLPPHTQSLLMVITFTLPLCTKWKTVNSYHGFKRWKWENHTQRTHYYWDFCPHENMLFYSNHLVHWIPIHQRDSGWCLWDATTQFYPELSPVHPPPLLPLLSKYIFGGQVLPGWYTKCHHLSHYLLIPVIPY